MASRLPSADTALGPLPSGQSGRQIATADLTGHAKGAAAIAEGVKDFGQGLKSFANSVMAADEREKALNDELEAARFTSSFAVEKLKTDAGITGVTGDEPDEDQGIVGQVASLFTPPTAGVATSRGTAGASAGGYTTPEGESPSTGIKPIDKQVVGLRSTTDQLLNRITDPRRREMMRLRVQDDIARSEIHAHKQATGIAINRQIASLDQRGQAVIARAVESDDVETNAKAISGHREEIYHFARKGWRSATQAQEMDRKWVNSYGDAKLEAMKRKGQLGQAISDMEEASLNAALVPPPPPKKGVGPQSSLGSYTPEQMASIRGKANAARPGEFWGDPEDPSFASERITPITLKSGKTVNVNKAAAAAFEGFLGELEDSGYDIKSIGGYNNRNIRGTNTKSQHAFGNAIDINPYAEGNGFSPKLQTNLPPNVSEMAAKYGISWGGDWQGKKDAMHFEFTGLQPAGKTQVAEAAGQPYKVASVDGAVAAPDGQPTTGQSLPAAGQQVAEATPRKPPTIFDAMDPEPREKLLQRAYTYRRQEEAQREKEHKAYGDFVLKEAFSRAGIGKLDSAYVENEVRPYVTPDEYKGLLKVLKGDDATDSPDALVDLTTNVDSLTPLEFQKKATSYLHQNMIKGSTYITFSEKNRAASRDDGPASPFKSGREYVKSALDTAPFQDSTGVITAKVKAALGQALAEYDIWAEDNPRATRAESMKQATEIIQRSRTLDIDLKVATPLSRYFGNKSKNDIKVDDIDQAELALMRDIRDGAISKTDSDFQIRRLGEWRKLLSRENALGTPGGK
jgi:hypothetical protein